jgi:acetyl esterase/lipase
VGALFGRRRRRPWLSRNGDLDRVFLAGDSAGGNIAHNVAVMAADRLDPAAAARIEGVVLLHPAFWGTEPIAGETREGAALMETLWSVVCPGAEGGVDDPRMNPLAAPTHHLPCKRLLVCAADGDILRQRARAYYEDVAASGAASCSGWSPRTRGTASSSTTWTAVRALCLWTASLPSSLDQAIKK